MTRPVGTGRPTNQNTRLVPAAMSTTTTTYTGPTTDMRMRYVAGIGYRLEITLFCRRPNHTHQHRVCVTNANPNSRSSTGA